MTTGESFARLGIPMTRDVEAIKTAYRDRLSHCHPEENPQGFMELHQAYKNALSYAQNKKSAGDSFDASPSWPGQPDREASGYDRLFSDLEREQETSGVFPFKKRFIWHLRWMHLHWLPISLKSWKQLLNSKAFYQCRRDEECMERLFALMVTKTHTYRVFLLLQERLWELEGWYSGEGLEDMAGRTRRCIAELRNQYDHCLNYDMNHPANRLLVPILRYYYALPFYFKLLVSIFLLPQMAFGSEARFFGLLLSFYVIEIGVNISKADRQLGPFHIKWTWKNGVATPKKRYGGLAIILAVYAAIIHAASCFSLFRGL